MHPLVEPELTEIKLITGDLGLKDTDNIWLPGSGDAAKLRKKLDDGRLTRVIKEYTGHVKQKNKPEDDRLPYRVRIILLGTCGLALGCKLPRSDLIDYIKANRHTMSLSKAMKDKIMEICRTYSEGDYCEDLFARDPAEEDEVMEDTDDGTIAVQSALRTPNSRSTPRTVTPELDEDNEDDSVSGEDEETPSLSNPLVQASLSPSVLPTPSKFTIQGCLNCGSKGHSDGMPLLICGACGRAVYCDNTW